MEGEDDMFVLGEQRVESLIAQSVRMFAQHFHDATIEGEELIVLLLAGI